MKTRGLTAVFLVVLIFGTMPIDGFSAVDRSRTGDTDLMEFVSLSSPTPPVLPTINVANDNSASSCDDVRLMFTDKGLKFEGCNESNRNCCNQGKLKKICHSGEVVLHPDKTLELVGCSDNIYQYNVCELKTGKVGFKIEIEGKTAFPSIFIRPSEDGTYKIPSTVTENGGYIVTYDDGSPPIFQHKNEEGEDIWFEMKPVLIPSEKLATGNIVPEGEPLLVEKKTEDGRLFYSFKNLEQQRDRLIHEFCPL